LDAGQCFPFFCHNNEESAVDVALMLTRGCRA